MYTMRRDGPSQLVKLPDDSVWQLDSSCVAVHMALHQLVQELDADRIVPAQNCGGIFSKTMRPELPKGVSCKLLRQHLKVQYRHLVVVPAAVKRVYTVLLCVAVLLWFAWTHCLPCQRLCCCRLSAGPWKGADMR